MRKIEREIIMAIKAKRTVNLSERDRIETKEGISTVILWNSEIVKINTNNETISFCFCNWNTNTTKNRIHLILSTFSNCSVYFKNFKPYLNDGNGEEIKINFQDVFTVDYNGKLLTAVKDGETLFIA